VDTTGVPRTERALPAGRGRRVILNLKTPARMLRLTTLGRSRYATPRRRDAEGRRWAFIVPPNARKKRDLLLSVTYPQGDAEFGFKLAPK
jgi:hypothetical protein